MSTTTLFLLIEYFRRWVVYVQHVNRQLSEFWLIMLLAYWQQRRCLPAAVPVLERNRQLSEFWLIMLLAYWQQRRCLPVVVPEVERKAMLMPATVAHPASGLDALQLLRIGDLMDGTIELITDKVRIRAAAAHVVFAEYDLDVVVQDEDGKFESTQATLMGEDALAQFVADHVTPLEVGVQVSKRDAHECPSNMRERMDHLTMRLALLHDNERREGGS